MTSFLLFPQLRSALAVQFKIRQVVILALLALCTLPASLSTAAVQGTAFTYQGQLGAGGSAANGNYDFTFALFNNSSTNSGQIGGTVTRLDVGVLNGLFTVNLDFGAVFTGNATWLAIGVRTNGGSSFAALNPLQDLTPAPYAIYAPNAGFAASANSVAATSITGIIPLAQLPAAVLTNNETSVTLSGAFSGVASNVTLVGGSNYTDPYLSYPTIPFIGFNSFYSVTNGTMNPCAGGGTNIYCNATEGFVLWEATNFVNDGMVAYANGQFLFELENWQGVRSNGLLTWDSVGFPHGIPWLASTLHKMGMKLCLYDEVQPESEIGDNKCCLESASLPDACNDAQTLASWGVDAVDVDVQNDYSGDYNRYLWQQNFMDCLKITGHPFYYSLHCYWPTPNYPYQGFTNGFQPWMRQANRWEIQSEWGSYTDVWQDVIYRWYRCASVSQWMDRYHRPYTFVIGGGEWPTGYGGMSGRFMLTAAAMFHSDIIWADDPMFETCNGWNIFATNQYIRQIQIDPLCLPPALLETNGRNTEIWTEPLNNGATAVAIINRSNYSETISVNATAFGIASNGAGLWFDCWNFTNFISSNNMVFASPPNSMQLWMVNAPAVALTNAAAFETASATLSGIAAGASGSIPSNSLNDVNGGGLTNLRASAITGGFTTNIVVGGKTLYYTNGILMNVQ